jgi:hypothetical protein
MQTRITSIRSMYRSALANPQVFDAMTAARDAAEEVCKELLGKDSGSLDDMIKEVKKKKLGPPGVIAALGALKAYGNYSAHRELDLKPPTETANSAMEALAYLVYWFIEQRHVDLSSPSLAEKVVAHDVPPKPPTFLERRRILREARVDRAARKLTIEPEASAESQRLAILSYYTELAEVAAAICRQILARETTLDPSTVAQVEPERLPLLVKQLSEQRPERLPRLAWATPEEVFRRKASIDVARHEQRHDIEPLLLEARQGNPIEKLVAWFARDYLRASLFERRGGQIIGLGLVFSAAYLFAEGHGETVGRTVRTQELNTLFCREGQVTNHQEVCRVLETNGEVTMVLTPVPTPVSR